MGIKIFFSYAKEDSQVFHISQIAKELKAFPEIDDVFYYEGQIYDDIYEYMDENLKGCDLLIIFCTENASDSKFVLMEWRSALSIEKKIIPIFIKKTDIPRS